jgi:hypothetical protein
MFISSFDSFSSKVSAKAMQVTAEDQEVAAKTGQLS